MIGSRAWVASHNARIARCGGPRLCLGCAGELAAKMERVEAEQRALFGPHWSGDPGPRPEFTDEALMEPRPDGEPLPSTDGRRWRNAVLGASGVLCATREDNVFCVWGPVEEIANAVFESARMRP